MKKPDKTSKPTRLAILFLGLLTGLITSSPHSYAQVGITAVPFLEINNDARSMGMAGANVAMRGARSGIHLNPAAFGKPNTLELTSQINFDRNGYFFGTPWLPGFDVDRLTIITPQFIAGFDKFSIGYQYTYLDLGKQYYTEPDSPDPISSFHSHERAHTFSVAYHFSPRFSVGAGINFIKSDLGQGDTEIDISAPERTTWDVGIYADYPVTQELVTITPSFGWSITDIGKPISYTSSSSSDPLPIIMRAGFGLEVTTNKTIFARQALRIAGYLSRDKIMARREAGGSPMKPIKAIFNSWDSFTRNTGTETVILSLRDQIRKHDGVEITVVEILSIRAGSFWEHEHNGNRKFTTRGFGVNYKYFSLDYAKLYTKESEHPLEGTQFLQFTANISFDDMKRLFD